MDREDPILSYVYRNGLAHNNGTLHNIAISIFRGKYKRIPQRKLASSFRIPPTDPFEDHRRYSPWLHATAVPQPTWPLPDWGPQTVAKQKARHNNETLNSFSTDF